MPTMQNPLKLPGVIRGLVLKEGRGAFCRRFMESRRLMTELDPFSL